MIYQFLGMICEGLSAFCLVLLLMPLYIKFALKAGLADLPRDSRRMHKRPIVTSAGVVLLFSVIPWFFFMPTTYSAFYAQGGLYAFMLAVGMSVVGFVDDRRAMPAIVKLLFELVSAGAAAFMLGFSSPYSFLFAVALIVFVTNSVNLTDGLDGLCACECCVCLFALFFLGLPTLPLLCGLTAFLFFNRPQASAFLGDCGSLFLGFFISVCFLCVIGERGPGCLPFLLMTLAYPVFDTLFAFSRRVLKGKSPFSPDKKHIHHRLVEAGLSVGSGVLVIFSASLFFALCGVLFLLGMTSFAVFLLLLTLLFTVVMLLIVLSVRRKNADVSRSAFRRE